MKEKRNTKISRTAVFSLLLFGALLCTIAIQMRLSGSRNLNQFYDVGKKYIVSYQYYTVSYPGCAYGADGRYHVSDNDVSLPFYAGVKKNGNWNYVYLDLKDMNREKMQVEVTEVNTSGEQVSRQMAEVGQGMNEIQISPQPSNGVILHIADQEGTVFRIHGMQFREKKSYYETSKVVKMFLLGMALYIAFVGILYRLFLKNVDWRRIYGIMDWITALYGRIAEALQFVGARIKSSTAGIIRRICFFVMIFLMLYTEAYGSYNIKNYYYIYMLINCGLIFVIALVSIEKGREKPDWKNPMMFSWVIYSILACVSDIIVPKNQMFTGVMMLTVYGLLFFVMAGMKKSIAIYHDFMIGVEISYFITSIFCLFCRPIGDMFEGRYNGCTISPYSYAMYTGMVIAVFLAELDRWLLEKKNKVYLVLYLTGIVSALYFVWLTQSRDGVLAVGICGLFFLFRVFCMRKVENYGKKTVFAIGVCVILAVPVLWIQDWCVHNLPRQLGTTVYFENDNRMNSKTFQEQKEEITEQELGENLEDAILPGNIVYAQDMDNSSGSNRLFHKAVSLDILSSGRITVYREYIALMNLWGHEKDPYIWGRKMRAHNAVLQTGYRYGIFVMIPYTVMLLYAGYYSLCYLRTNWLKNPTSR